MTNIDFHTHSTTSDGLLTPSELVLRAKENGVNCLALTDHDEVSGITEAKKEASRLGITLISGVEISVTWARKTIHVVGLNINENDPVLIERLKDNREGREKRAHQIAQKFDALGIPGTFEGAMQFVTNPTLISRKHFARYLVSSKILPSTKEAFDKYLKEDGPAYIPHKWASLSDSVKWILQAGGIAVLAHPGRYRLTDMQRDALLSEFKAAGGVGIEVVTGSHTKEDYAYYTQIAKQYDFYASKGSDFHGDKDFNMDVACVPELAHDLKPVWSLLKIK